MSRLSKQGGLILNISQINRPSRPVTEKALALLSVTETQTFITDLTSVFIPKTYTLRFRISHIAMLATSYPSFIKFDVTILITSDEVYKLQGCSSCNIFRFSSSFPVLDLNALLRTPFLKT